ncbi:MAG: bifunctional adenosylcobinamide kinase/adenosylcobinamide-phosphate guanylyltransferase [Sphaerochaetaceae bacterium]|jgi:adenosylcobinamide kinase/adenosylcobinamide-phosphate guanylyltransferase|nr:bifunctional adenosylcobinamide kinase/adenosylcobinamide-phosphate guanylyltransferase [Sphaerochaetaceae bacterium]MDD3163795.1 bifunctional adenosylcobinamide kinase/adenosylcobinamide-phosphate guanylyltransferase [Sphaerochaetaceae bacterium]MDD4006674.1 bifunctional adenosylcobinamide kinase/adenosylcobinamide-phosphate guanylyltransferase [Sphaerochaetaceae bacterium]MDD4396640.1 bifunctional adenosylcobinamide kinase/adenosylcobinamide-phosphate guanylyltransferase [Sphaerochaetaceae 
MIHLILGGARSGKSTRAEMLCLDSSLLAKPIYIATAEPFDDEMRSRIKLHQQRREDRFITVEEPIALGSAITSASHEASSIMVDCITVWLGNIQYHNVMEQQIPLLLSALRAFPDDRSLFLVSNELTEGLVPESALSREYRDRAGFLNQDLASIADRVTLMVAGIPLEIKK